MSCQFVMMMMFRKQKMREISPSPRLLYTCHLSNQFKISKIGAKLCESNQDNSRFCGIMYILSWARSHWWLVLPPGQSSSEAHLVILLGRLSQHDEGDDRQNSKYPCKLKALERQEIRWHKNPTLHVKRQWYDLFPYQSPPWRWALY